MTVATTARRQEALRHCCAPLVRRTEEEHERGGEHRSRAREYQRQADRRDARGRHDDAEDRRDREEEVVEPLVERERARGLALKSGTPKVFRAWGPSQASDSIQKM
jgi:hypothetical protein